MIRFFYDALPAEPAAAPTLSIAELMASKGSKSDPDRSGPPAPITIPEKKEEPVPEPTKVEPTGATQPEQAKSEPPPQPAEPKVEPPAPIEPVQPKLPTLQEFLKNHQPDTVLKALGYDDSIVGLVGKVKNVDPKMVALLDYWQEHNGDLTPFLQAATTDYSNMTAEDIMRHKIQQEYPKASKQQLEILYRRDVVKAYNLDSDDEEEKINGKLLLEADADKARPTLIANQQTYLVPKPAPPKPSEPDPKEQQDAKEFELYQQNINDSPLTKSMVANKKLVIGEGETAYNHAIQDPQKVLKILFDPDEYANNFFIKEKKPDGSVDWVPDVEKQLFVAAALTDFKGLQKNWADHYIAIGKNAAIAPIENAKPPGQNAPSPAEAEPKTAAEAMARKGTYHSGGVR